MSIAKFKQSVDTGDVLGAILSLDEIEDLDAECNYLNGRVPLGYAIENGMAVLTSLIIEHGANINMKDEAYWAPIHFAASTGQVETVEILLKAGAHVDATDYDNWTSLHLAVSSGHLQVVRLLLQYGADVQATTEAGSKPSDFAESKDMRDLLEQEFIKNA